MEAYIERLYQAVCALRREIVEALRIDIILTWLERRCHDAAIMVCAVGAIGALAVAVIVQFQNPAMTQTQLL